MFKSITPYFFFDGTCREAMNFYKEVFGGELTIMDYNDAPPEAQCGGGDKNRVMHAALKSGNLMLLASDTPEGPAQKGTNLELSLECEKMADLDRAFQELSKGGSVTAAPHDAFWGSRFAMLTDKYGFRWMLSAPGGQK